MADVVADTDIRPVTVVPIVRPVEGQPQANGSSAHGDPRGLEAAQLDELFSEHVSKCVDDLFEARSCAILAYGHAGPRCQALLCMPGAPAPFAGPRKLAPAPFWPPRWPRDDPL